MPRHPPLFIPEATYHVYCRVTRGEFVFDDPFEAAEFVSAVREVRDLHGWKIFAWTLMANHYHLVIKTGAIPLWRSMLRLQSETEVARFIQKHPTSVARWISLGLRKQLEYRSFRERIDDIDRRISSKARNNPRMP